MDGMEIVDFTIDGKCSCCGKCCSDLLPLSDAEIVRIKAYIRKHGIKEQRHNFVVGYDLTCPFRDDVNKKCLIYNVRPAICREFMCNHSHEDIMKAKLDFHKINRVVFMRKEFYGSKEEDDFFASFGFGGVF